MQPLRSSTRSPTPVVAAESYCRAVRKLTAMMSPARKLGAAIRGRTLDRHVRTPRAATTRASAENTNANVTVQGEDIKRMSKPSTNGCKTLALVGVACATVLLAPGVAKAAASAVSDAAANAAEPASIASMIKSAISFVLHLDVHLGDIISKYGMATYGILFAIVFAETGLVVTPLLPGDSLLFATGALAALGKLNILALFTLYAVAATLGDAVNYAIGKYLGDKAVDAKLIKKAYMDKTQKFYQKYGPKTIVLARFVPIVRTFAPFVAGVGRMAYQQFALYNVVGALLWTSVCTFAGYCFGNIPIIHDNFSLVVLGIIAVSVLPILFELLMAAAQGRGNPGRSGRLMRSGSSLTVSFS